jgi:plastocyanin
MPPVTRTPRSLLTLLAVLVTTGPALAACADEAGGPEASGDPATSDANGGEVVVELLAFQPELLEVAAGAVVTWQQRDVAAHTIVSGTVEAVAGGVTQQPDGAFESGPLATGERFEHTFDEPGTYPYFCSLHPATMRGEIRVT